MMTIKTNKTNKPFSFYKEGFISLSALLYSNKLLWSISQTSLVLGGGVGMVVVGAKRPPPVKRGSLSWCLCGGGWGPTPRRRTERLHQPRLPQATEPLTQLPPYQPRTWA